MAISKNTMSRRILAFLMMLITAVSIFVSTATMAYAAANKDECIKNLKNSIGVKIADVMENEGVDELYKNDVVEAVSKYLKIENAINECTNDGQLDVVMAKKSAEFEKMSEKSIAMEFLQYEIDEKFEISELMREYANAAKSTVDKATNNQLKIAIEQIEEIKKVANKGNSGVEIKDGSSHIEVSQNKIDSWVDTAVGKIVSNIITFIIQTIMSILTMIVVLIAKIFLTSLASINPSEVTNMIDSIMVGLAQDEAGKQVVNLVTVNSILISTAFFLSSFFLIIEIVSIIMSGLSDEKNVTSPVALVIRYLMSIAMITISIPLSEAVWSVFADTHNQWISGAIDGVDLFPGSFIGGIQERIQNLPDYSDVIGQSALGGIGAFISEIAGSIFSVMVFLLLYINLLQLIFELAQRFAVSIIYIYLGPLCCATYTSPSKSQIAKKWMSASLSQNLLMMLNGWATAIALRVVVWATSNASYAVGGDEASGVYIFAKIILAYGILKSLQQLDDIFNNIGWNVIKQNSGLLSDLMSMQKYKDFGSGVLKTAKGAAGFVMGAAAGGSSIFNTLTGRNTAKIAKNPEVTEKLKELGYGKSGKDGDAFDPKKAVKQAQEDMENGSYAQEKITGEKYDTEHGFEGFVNQRYNDLLAKNNDKAAIDALNESKKASKTIKSAEAKIAQNEELKNERDKLGKQKSEHESKKESLNGDIKALEQDKEKAKQRIQEKAKAAIAGKDDWEDGRKKKYRDATRKFDEARDKMLKSKLEELNGTTQEADKQSNLKGCERDYVRKKQELIHDAVAKGISEDRAKELVDYAEGRTKGVKINNEKEDEFAQQISDNKKNFEKEYMKDMNKAAKDWESGEKPDMMAQYEDGDPEKDYIEAHDKRMKAENEINGWINQEVDSGNLTNITSGLTNEDEANIRNDFAEYNDLTESIKEKNGKLQTEEGEITRIGNEMGEIERQVLSDEEMGDLEEAKSIIKDNAAKIIGNDAAINQIAHEDFRGNGSEISNLVMHGDGTVEYDREHVEIGENGEQIRKFEHYDPHMIKSYDEAKDEIAKKDFPDISKHYTGDDIVNPTMNEDGNLSCRVGDYDYGPYLTNISNEAKENLTPVQGREVVTITQSENGESATMDIRNGDEVNKYTINKTSKGQYIISETGTKQSEAGSRVINTATFSIEPSEEKDNGATASDAAAAFIGKGKEKIRMVQAAPEGSALSEVYNNGRKNKNWNTKDRGAKNGSTKDGGAKNGYTKGKKK